METIREEIRGEVVEAWIAKNIWGEFLVTIGIQVVRFNEANQAHAMVDDYMAMIMKQAA